MTKGGSFVLAIPIILLMIGLLVVEWYDFHMQWEYPSYKRGATLNMLTRFRAIMTSNLQAIIDQAEDPENMINQYMRDLRSDLGKVKSETASIMAEEQRARRAWNECAAEIDKMKLYAIKALEVSHEVDARKFLEKKSMLAAEEVELRKAYEAGVSNTKKMSVMHDKLVTDMSEMESRLALLKGELSAAKTQELFNKLNASTKTLEDQVNLAMDSANAAAEINSTFDENFEEAMATYNDPIVNIDSELEALKESIKKK